MFNRVILVRLSLSTQLLVPEGIYRVPHYLDAVYKVCTDEVNLEHAMRNSPDTVLGR